MKHCKDQWKCNVHDCPLKVQWSIIQCAVSGKCAVFKCCTLPPELVPPNGITLGVHTCNSPSCLNLLQIAAIAKE